MLHVDLNNNLVDGHANMSLGMSQILNYRNECTSSYFAWASTECHEKTVVRM